MSLRYVSVVFVAVVLAMVAVMAASSVRPEEASAAGAISVRGCSGTVVKMDSNEKRMLDLHNRKRAGAGLPRFCVHPALQRAAEAHSRDMINRDYFSHNTRGSGKTPAVRIRSAGYGYRTAGENIAWGSGSLGSHASIFKSWMNSPGHRVNILNKSFKEIGIGAATGTYKSYSGATAWTADFGSR